MTIYLKKRHKFFLFFNFLFLLTANSNKEKIALCLAKCDFILALDADEIFLTNSLAEVLPVTRVDSSKIGSGRVGECTKLFRISYQKEVIKEVVK